MKRIICLLLMGLLVGCGSQSSNQSIMIYSRDASSGTREAFEKVTDLKGNLSADAFTVDSNGDMATKIGADENGIGYASLATDFQASGIKPISFEGTEPTAKTVLDQSYKMQRPFSFVTRSESDFESDEKKQLVLAFVDFMQNSTEGMQLVESAGGVVNIDNSTPWEELKKKHPIVEQDNSHLTLITAGSTSVEKTVKVLLEAFQAEAGQFQFKMNQSGSSDGYKRVLGSEKDGPNSADIGFASREFEEKEDTTEAMAKGVYCLDAVVVVVNEKNESIKDLNKQQIYDIFSGKIKTWDELK